MNIAAHLETIGCDAEFLQSNYFVNNDFQIKTFEYNEIMKVAVEVTGFTEIEIKSKCKKQELVMIRYYLFHYLKKQKKHSYGDIAHHFNRNKGNIYYGYNEAKNMILTNFKPFLDVKQKIETAFAEL